MSFINDKIGDWTPAQLQSFIQSITSVDAAQIPSSLNFTASEIAAGKIGNLDLTNKLNMADKVGISKANVPINEALVLSSDENSQLQWQPTQDWEAVHVDIGDGWSGMNYHPSQLSSAGSPALTNQRLTLQLVYAKKKITTNAFFYNVVTGDSGATYTENGYALYAADADGTPWTPGMTSITKIKDNNNGSSAGVFSSTGNFAATFSGPIADLDPGYYFFGFLTVWSAMGTTPVLFGAGARGLHAAFPGGFSRSCGFNSHTGGFPPTITTADSGFTNFDNVIWVGAQAA